MSLTIEKPQLIEPHKLNNRYSIGIITLKIFKEDFDFWESLIKKLYHGWDDYKHNRKDFEQLKKELDMSLDMMRALKGVDEHVDDNP